tara:strand:+ start:444 stop:1286 length:843 start_codon:yes stop_codon:yes gene_type:complete
VTFYKKLIILFALFAQDITAIENNIDEYKVEIVMFKFNNIETNEQFTDEITLPKKDVINLIEPRLSLNKDALNNFSENKSFFSNLLKNINPRKVQENITTNQSKSSVNPKVWYRKSSNIDNLSSLKNKIISNNQIEYLDSKSWIQSIDNENESKYVFLENHEKEFGFFLKLYKKRFLHLDLKAYLGVNNEQTIESTESYVKKYESQTNNNSNINSELDVKIYLPEESKSIELLNKPNEWPINKPSTRLNKFIDINKRIFNEEIHLFDHPNFGVIVTISKI